MEPEATLTPREKIPSKGKILLRGGSNPRRCITQDNEPTTLLTGYFGPNGLPIEQQPAVNSAGHTLTDGESIVIAVLAISNNTPRSMKELSFPRFPSLSEGCRIAKP